VTVFNQLAPAVVDERYLASTYEPRSSFSLSHPRNWAPRVDILDLV
jgi:hypothetical protein